MDDWTAIEWLFAMGVVAIIGVLAWRNRKRIPGVGGGGSGRGGPGQRRK